ncbi:ABC transporter permease [Chloroflexota bacterium]
MDRSRTSLAERLYPYRYGLKIVPILFLGIFFFYPLLTILAVSFAPNNTLELSGFIDIFTSSYYRNTLIFTLWQALLSTTLTLLLALPGSYVFARYDFPGKRILLSLSVLPFVLPTIVVAAAFTTLIGPQGVINSIIAQIWGNENAPVIQLQHTLAIILIAHIFYNYPLALRMISSYWGNQSLRAEEAAQLLGAHGWRLWMQIRLPMLRPILLATAALVFMFTFTSFGVILILGGPRFATIEVEIYRQATSIFNLPVAAALSVIQIGGMGIMLVYYTRLQNRIATTSLSSTRQVARPPQQLSSKIFVFANIALMMCLLFVPLIALATKSFSGNAGFTVDYYRHLTENSRDSILFVPPIKAISNSLLFAGATTILAVVLGLIATTLLASRTRISRWLDPIFMLPLATSAVTLGFGFIVALDEPPLNLRTSPVLIPLAHTLVAMPFVIRSVLPAIKQIPKETQEAALGLGASPWRVWVLIDFPLIKRGLIVGAIFAFTVSMGEFGATVFVARPDTPTIPVVIYRLLGQPGVTNYGQALAMSVILVLVCGVSFVVIERLGTAGTSEF